VYSHKTQLCAIKYVYYIYYNDMFRPSTAIISLYMKTSSICTIDHRSSVWMGWVEGYFARSRLGLGCADQLVCLSCVNLHILTTDEISQNSPITTPSTH